MAYFGPGSTGADPTGMDRSPTAGGPYYFDPQNFQPAPYWASSFPQLPGESVGAYYNRLKLAAYRDAQLAGIPGISTTYSFNPDAARVSGPLQPTGGIASFTGGAQPQTGGTTGAVPAGGPDVLEQQRQAAFGALARQRQLYEDPMAIRAQQAVMGGMLGAPGFQPFGPDVVSGLLAESADAAAGRAASEQEAIRRAFAGAGLTGSGLEASAMISSRREAGRMASRGRRQIRTQAELENFRARERARSEAQQFLAQRAAAQWLPTQSEVGLRSRFEVTGESPYGGTNVSVGGQQVPTGPSPAQQLATAGPTLAPTTMRATGTREQPAQFGPQLGGVLGGEVGGTRTSQPTIAQPGGLLPPPSPYGPTEAIQPMTSPIRAPVVQQPVVATSPMSLVGSPTQGTGGIRDPFNVYNNPALASYTPGTGRSPTRLEQERLRYRSMYG